MNKNESSLAGVAASAHSTMHGRVLEQIGAICIRTADGNVEVLLITTRETHRWTIPKGWPIDGRKPHEVAELEAWEEAGVRGKAKRKPLGFYTYLKKLGSGQKVPSVVEVHLLQVDEISDTFPEHAERIVEWMSPVDAAGRVPEPELKQLLAGLVVRLAAWAAMLPSPVSVLAGSVT
jgi:8-oxo-dGTP pyrophosphatase MutT (NUDIX family)